MHPFIYRAAVVSTPFREALLESLCDSTRTGRLIECITDVVFQFGGETGLGADGPTGEVPGGVTADLPEEGKSDTAAV